jgi:ribosome-associated toxin RatA of RatAB toxin-antitoxin module
MEVHKTALVAHPVESMFDLIEAAENYPLFLPWCASVTILERSDTTVSASIVVNYHGVKFTLVNRNTKCRPAWLAIDMEQGPFRRFTGNWSLTPLDAEGCKIEFRLQYDFASPVLERVAGPVFDRIANTFMDAFVERANTLRLRANTFAKTFNTPLLPPATTASAAPIAEPTPASPPDPAPEQGG